MPRRQTVPEIWKTENGGPWVLGPDGWWWQTGLFEQEPWKTSPQIMEPTGPSDFVGLFGRRPSIEEWPSETHHRAALQRWEESLLDFRGVGWPAWATADQVVAVSKVYVVWRMGPIVGWTSNRYGSFCRFPQLTRITGGIRRYFDFPSVLALTNAHICIMKYQSDEFQAGRDPSGGDPEKIHSWLRPPEPAPGSHTTLVGSIG